MAWVLAAAEYHGVMSRIIVAPGERFEEKDLLLALTPQTIQAPHATLQRSPAGAFRYDAATAITDRPSSVSCHQCCGRTDL